MSEVNPPWQIRIDVGGTFTDGWALSPTGEEIRCKVLSSGILRTRVAAHLPEGWVEVERPLSLHDSGLEGFRSSCGKLVLDSSPSSSRLLLDELPAVGDILELSTGEDAPVLASRILTGTSPSVSFPEADLRVATTRGTNALLEHKGEPVTLVTTKGFETLLEVRDQRRPDLFELKPTLTQPIVKEVISVSGRLNRDGSVLEPLDLSGLPKPEGPVAVALINSDVSPEYEKKVSEYLGGEVSISHELAPVIRLWPRMETAVANAYLTPVMGQFVENLRKALPDVPLSLMTSAGQLKEVQSFRPVDSLLSGPAGGVAGSTALAKATGFSQVLTFDMGGTSTDVARIAGEPNYRYEQEIGPVRVLAPAVKIETVAAGGGSICQWRNGGLEVGPESAGSNPGPACYGRGGPLTITDVNLLLGLMDEGKAGIPLDKEASQTRLDELRQQIGEEIDPQELLKGLRKIAIEHMADALRQVSTRDGYDCREHALIAFGGAGPQHACSLARELGIRTVLIPAEAGLLSAWGLHQSVHKDLQTRQILKPLDEMRDEFPKIIEELSSGISRCLHEVRLQGQDSCLEIEAEDVDDLISEFESRYLKLYGYARPSDRLIEWVAVRVESSKEERELEKESFDEGTLVEADQIEQDVFSTLYLEKGWRVRRGSRGSICLELEEQVREENIGPGVVEEELFRRRYESVVEEMGMLLRRTALSTNIKERLDYSCALLDAKGRLVVNAPHIPVHLGALGLCVRKISENRVWRDGDVVVVNHPAYGGSHLPDVTVISPVFIEGLLAGFVANRAHHAEIGGRTPGSMPPDATCLAEEGIVIPPILYSDMGEGFFDESRSPGDNIADLAAQVAANRHGVKALQDISETHHMETLYQRAARIFAQRLQGFTEAGASSSLDDGSTIRVHLSYDQKLRVDFRGSAPTHPGNLNATPAIVRSAVLYVLRLWVNEDFPLNEGLLEHVEIVTEEGILSPPLVDDPEKCPAVVGGNVETSQRIVDVLLMALGLQANGQGTMNNFLFGNESFGFYETMGGGAGAGDGWNGRSGCHVHMSNTAITDAEILEERYPVRVREFGLREESGGRGAWNGGDGLVREIEFRESMTVSLLTQRRTTYPQGLLGGGDGKMGQQILFRDGRTELVPGITALDIECGDRIRIETPGGGAFGDL